jgi:ABC-type transporter Mla subunit MlaD
MTARNVRVALITASGILLLAIAWVVWVALHPQYTSGGGTASQYSVSK